MGIVAAMGFELSHDVFRAEELRESERRMDLAIWRQRPGGQYRRRFVQQEVGKYAQTFLEYPPMQEGASFNMSALKAEFEKKKALGNLRDLQ